MKEVSLEELLEAGCHFGHQVTRGNPKARDYIFEARDNIHIIDLVKTKKELEKALAFILDHATKNGSLLVLGTKRQAQEVINEEIERARNQLENKADNKIYYVIQRWIGGTFTNFSEVKKNFKKLKDLNEKLSSIEEKAKYTKKEVGLWQKKKQKLETFYGGIVDMEEVPGAIFVVDSHNEKIAIDEAIRMGITSVAITDTNADPHLVDYPIPANDDATGSIKLIVKAVIDAWIEGRQKGQKIEEARRKKEAVLEKKAEAKASKPKEKEVKSKTIKKVKLEMTEKVQEKPVKTSKK